MSHPPNRIVSEVSILSQLSMSKGKEVIRVSVTTAGESSLSELAVAVKELKRGDLLRAVFVVAPSKQAALALRRRLALSEGSGLVNVSYGTFVELAYMLAEESGALAKRKKLDSSLERAFVRSAIKSAIDSLAGSVGESGISSLRDVLTNSYSVRSLVDSFRRLSEKCDLGELERLASSRRDGRLQLPLESAVVLDAYLRFKNAYRSDYYDDSDLFGFAAEALEGMKLKEVPAVVVYLPMQLTLREERLLAALTGATQVFAIVGYTGDDAADRYLAEIAQRLNSIGADRPASTDESKVTGGPEPPRPLVCTAIDSDEEIRSALRLLQNWCSEGADPAAAAIAYTSRSPYKDALTGYLSAAGVEFWGVASRTLGETSLGVLLKAILAVAEHDFRRDTVVDLAYAIPSDHRRFRFAGTDYKVVPELWDRLSREAGVQRGASEWIERMGNHAADLPAQDSENFAAAASKAACAFVEMLQSSLPEPLVESAPEDGSADTEPDRSPSWTMVSSSLVSLLTSLTGTTFQRGSENAEDESEASAADRVLSSLKAMARLDATDGPPDKDGVLSEVRAILEAPAPSGRKPKGICVGPLNDLAGVPLESVFVIGAVEGALPAPAPEDSLIQPIAKALGRDDLALGGPSVQEQRARLFTLLRSARNCALSHPMADLRQRRPSRVSWWLLDVAGDYTKQEGQESDGDGGGSSGLVLGHDDLVAGRCGAWHIFVPSLEAGIKELGVADHQELNILSLLEEIQNGTDFDQTSIVRSAPVLRRRTSRTAALKSASVDHWWGSIRLADDVSDLRLRPTALEIWSVCPYRYFLANVLALRDLDRPEETFETSPSDLGTAVHEALRRIFEEGIDRDTPDEDARIARRREIAERFVDELFSPGSRNAWLRGDRSLIEAQKARLLRALEIFIVFEELLERDLGLLPWKFEYPFERTVPLEKTGLELRMSGRADRIDRVEDGRSIAVIDYKTGRSGSKRSKQFKDSLEKLGKTDDVSELMHCLKTGQSNISRPKSRSPLEMLAGGSFLQLPVYALAALQLESEDIERVITAIWHIDIYTGQNEIFGASLERSDLDEVVKFVEEMAESISAGIFVPNPGKEKYRAAGENCQYCDFDDVCPRDRGVIWKRKSSDHTFLRFAELTNRLEQG